MIADHRTHELKAGIVREFLALREKENHSDTLVGFLADDVGNVSAIMHISAREELAVGAKRRPAMADDPAERPYLQKSREYLNDIGNKMLVPISFSPTK
jgi:NIPSNAP protein